MNRRGERGVTLIEMLVVVSIVAVMVAIMFPSVTTGLDSIRLASAADNVAAFMNSAVNRAERRQVLLEFSVSVPENALYYRHVPDFEKRYELPDGIRIDAVLPEVPYEEPGARRFQLYPGGAPPRIGVRIVSPHGARRIVSLDPVTGVPIIERFGRGQTQ